MNIENLETLEIIKNLLPDLYQYSKENLPFEKHIKKIHFQISPTKTKQEGKTYYEFFENTGYYNPATQEVVLYINGRHPKDILRTFSHELVHHKQNVEGKLKNLNKLGNDSRSVQKNKRLRSLEEEAYLSGNLIFRDWEDKIKENGINSIKNKLKLNIMKETVKKYFKTNKRIISENKKSILTKEDVNFIKQLDQLRRATNPNIKSTETQEVHMMITKGLSVILNNLFNLYLTSSQSGYGYDFTSKNLEISYYPFGIHPEEFSGDIQIVIEINKKMNKQEEYYKQFKNTIEFINYLFKIFKRR